MYKPWTEAECFTMHKLRAIAILILVYGLTVSLAAQMSSKSAQTRREATTPSISLAPLSPSFQPETECRHFQSIG